MSLSVHAQKQRQELWLILTFDTPFFMGVSNVRMNPLAAIASNREGFVPRLVNGRPLKACNQWYNKRMKELKKITYKASLVGIQVEVTEESYTSKASFLDLDPIPTYKPNDEEERIFSGKRIGRRNRLYRTKDGRTICADVNGAYNILRKRKPDAFSKAKGPAAYVVQPVRQAV